MNSGNDPLSAAEQVAEVMEAMELTPLVILQIVNFGGRFPAVIKDALAPAPQRLSKKSRLRVIPLPQLVALKLYAGGLKSKTDLVELLKRNPAADLKMIRALCASYRLPGFDEVLAELKSP